MCTQRHVPLEARGVGSAGAGIMGGCEQPDVGAKSESRGLCKSKMCS